MSKRQKKIIESISGLMISIIGACIVGGFFLLGFIYGNESIVPYLPAIIGLIPLVAFVVIRAEVGDNECID